MRTKSIFGLVLGLGLVFGEEHLISGLQIGRGLGLGWMRLRLSVSIRIVVRDMGSDYGEAKGTLGWG